MEREREREREREDVVCEISPQGSNRVWIPLAGMHELGLPVHQIWERKISNPRIQIHNNLSSVDNSASDQNEER